MGREETPMYSSMIRDALSFWINLIVTGRLHNPTSIMRHRDRRGQDLILLYTKTVARENLLWALLRGNNLRPNHLVRYQWLCTTEVMDQEEIPTLLGMMVACMLLNTMDHIVLARTWGNVYNYHFWILGSMRKSIQEGKGTSKTKWRQQNRASKIHSTILEMKKNLLIAEINLIWKIIRGGTHRGI